MVNESDKRDSLDRTRIAQAIFAEAEAMGIADRQLVERLISQAIERLEKPPTLPGMEGLVPRFRYKPKQLPTVAEVQAIVKEILESKELAYQNRESNHKEEVKPKMETAIVKPKLHTNIGVKLTENALRVLERRYLE